MECMRRIRVWWDNVKYEIKKYSIRYSSLFQNIKRKEELIVKKVLKEELHKENGDIEIILENESRLKEIEGEKCRGAMIRSRAKNVIEGERCTKFFFSLEENRQRADTIKEVLKHDGSRVKGTKEILESVKEFYARCYGQLVSTVHKKIQVQQNDLQVFICPQKSQLTEDNKV